MADSLYETTRIEIAPHREAGTSDDVIRDIFRAAAEGRRRAAFLRLGGPRPFREEVIQVTTEEGVFTDAFQRLLDRRIAGIEFVLADPRFEPFLGRMDAERKGFLEKLLKYVTG